VQSLSIPRPERGLECANGRLFVDDVKGLAGIPCKKILFENLGAKILVAQRLFKSRYGARREIYPGDLISLIRQINDFVALATGRNKNPRGRLRYIGKRGDQSRARLSPVPSGLAVLLPLLPAGLIACVRVHADRFEVVVDASEVYTSTLTFRNVTSAETARDIICG